MSIIIRPESTADHDAIRHVNRLAFGQDDEARLVDALRDGGFLRVSLVAEQAGQVVGHILFSDLPIHHRGPGRCRRWPLPRWRSYPNFRSKGSGRRWCRRDWRRAGSRATGSSSSWATRTSTHGSGSRRSWLRTWNRRFRAATPSWRWSWCRGAGRRCGSGPVPAAVRSLGLTLAPACS